MTTFKNDNLWLMTVNYGSLKIEASLAWLSILSPRIQLSQNRISGIPEGVVQGIQLPSTKTSWSNYWLKHFQEYGIQIESKQMLSYLSGKSAIIVGRLSRWEILAFRFSFLSHKRFYNGRYDFTRSLVSIEKLHHSRSPAIFRLRLISDLNRQ